MVLVLNPKNDLPAVGAVCHANEKAPNVVVAWTRYARLKIVIE